MKHAKFNLVFCFYLELGNTLHLANKSAVIDILMTLFLKKFLYVGENNVRYLSTYLLTDVA